MEGKEDDGCTMAGKPEPGGSSTSSRIRNHRNLMSMPKTIAFGIVHKGRHLILHGSKIANLERGSKDENWTLGREWKVILDPEWEVDSESGLESDRKVYRKAERSSNGRSYQSKE
jgi:hypothetical protein